MERESGKHPGKMSAILKLPLDAVQQVVNELSTDGVVSIANHNTDSQIVITGIPDLVTKASKMARRMGGVGVPLKVSGAWHSAMMKDAQHDFQTFLDTVVFNTPYLPVIFNVTAAVEQNPERIKALMTKQLVSPVRWYDSIIRMIDDNIHTFVEIGPGKVLAGLLGNIIPDQYPHKIYGINGMKTLEMFFEENV